MPYTDKEINEMRHFLEHVDEYVIICLIRQIAKKIGMEKARPIIASIHAQSTRNNVTDFSRKRELLRETLEKLKQNE